MAEELIQEQAEEKHGKGNHRRKRVLIPLVLVLIVAGAAIFYWYVYLRGYVSTDDAMIDCDAVTISSKILGRIVTLNADEGDSVDAGDTLVRIDDTSLRAEQARAEAALDYVQRNVAVARIALQRARDDFSRDSIQFRDHVITREQFDHARQAVELAQAQEAVAASQVKSSQAQLAVIETELANTKVVSATRGVVARKWVVPGDIIQPGQPIFTMYDLHKIWVTANFEETKLSSIHPGDTVDISVDAYPGMKLAGTVDLIGAAAASQFSLIPPNNASGNFTKVTQRVPIKIMFTDLGPQEYGDPPTLLPGMSVGVKVRVK